MTFRTRFAGYLRQHHLALVALFFSLSLGTAWAATELPSDSVGSDQIREGGVAIDDIRYGNVGTEEIRTNGVQGIDVRDGTLFCRDFATSEPACARGATGPAGPAGEAGVTGATGPAGADAVGGAGLTTTTVRSHTETIELSCSPDSMYAPGIASRCSGGPETARVSCDAGEQATGGSYELAPRFYEQLDGPPYTVRQSRGAVVGNDVPDPNSGTPIAWQVEVQGSGTSYNAAGDPTPPPDPTVTVYVVCADSGDTGPTGATGSPGA